MKKLKIVLLLFLLFSLREIKAQIPVNDPAWILQTSASEEFNSTLDTVNKWYSGYSWTHVNSGAEYNYPSNLIQTGTTLKIKADTLVPGVHISPSAWSSTPSVGVTYVYQGGAVQTRSGSYKFGYIEVYAKYPTSYWPLWPASWLHACPGNYNEIDFAENGADDSYNGYIVGTDRWVNLVNCSQTNGVDNSPMDITVSPLLSSAFHKYAFEWAPDRINIYFDDVLIRSLYDASTATIPQNAMFVFLNFAIDPYYALLPSDWTALAHGNNTPTSWPKYFEIDYMRYYKLNTACSTTLAICTSSDYSGRAVQKSITTGGACSPTINTSDAYTLRATDYVVLDAGTTINDNGSGFFAVITMACPQ